MNRCYETERLYLKILDEKGADLVCDYYVRNKDFLREWKPIRLHSFYTKEYQIEQLKEEIDEIRKQHMLKLWVFLKENPDKIIGVIAFNNIVKGAFMSCHLGYKLDKDYINRGYITEGLRKGIEIIFKEYKLHRIEANVMPKNCPSIRVCEKLGFYREGLAKDYLKINGIWEDHIHMVLLNEEV